MILRTSIVVTAFNNSNTICDVLKDLVLNTPFPVLVLDCGSSCPVCDSLYSWDVRQAMETGRVRIIRWEKERGYGTALQFAIHDLVAQGFTHMITVDGGGRDSGRDVMQVTAIARKAPWSLIMGSQNKKGLSRLADLLVDYLTGVRIRNSISTLRLYPLMLLQTRFFFSWGKSFALEVLIRMLWARVSVLETPLGQTTVDLSAKVSRRETPLRCAAAVAVGVFVACTPFLGLQTALVFFLAVILRLNFLIMLVASLISIPAIYPFLLLASVYIGAQWLGIPLAEQGFAQKDQWLFGSLVLGSILGSVLGGITFVIGRIAIIRKIRWRGLQTIHGLLEFYSLVRPQVGFFPRLKFVFRHLLEIRRKSTDESLTPARFNEKTRLVSAHCGSWRKLKDVGALMLDRVSSGSYEVIPFFGRLALFDVGLFRDAANDRVPLTLVLLSSRSDDGSLIRPSRVYRFADNLPQELQLYAWAEQQVRDLESFVNEHPSQWRNLYPFWTRPVLPKDPASELSHDLLEDLPIPRGLEAVFCDDDVRGRPVPLH